VAAARGRTVGPRPGITSYYVIISYLHPLQHLPLLGCRCVSVICPNIMRSAVAAAAAVVAAVIICCCRVLKKNPELIEEFIDRAAALLHDKNQGVALSGVTLMLHITSLEPAAVERYRAHVPTLCKMLRGLLQVNEDCGGLCGGQRWRVLFVFVWWWWWWWWWGGGWKGAVWVQEARGGTHIGGVGVCGAGVVVCV